MRICLEQAALATSIVKAIPALRPANRERMQVRLMASRWRRRWPEDHVGDLTEGVDFVAGAVVDLAVHEGVGIDVGASRTRAARLVTSWLRTFLRVRWMLALSGFLSASKVSRSVSASAMATTFSLTASFAKPAVVSAKLGAAWGSWTGSSAGLSWTTSSCASISRTAC